MKSDLERLEYGLMRLDALNRVVKVQFLGKLLGRHGFNHFERSYSSAVHWGVPNLGIFLNKHTEFK